MKHATAWINWQMSLPTNMICWIMDKSASWWDTICSLLMNIAQVTCCEVFAPIPVSSTMHPKFSWSAINGQWLGPSQASDMTSHLPIPSTRSSGIYTTVVMLTPTVMSQVSGQTTSLEKESLWPSSMMASNGIILIWRWIMHPRAPLIWTLMTMIQCPSMIRVKRISMVRDALAKSQLLQTTFVVSAFHLAPNSGLFLSSWFNETKIGFEFILYTQHSMNSTI